MPGNERADIAQVFGHGLGLVQKAAVGGTGMADGPGLKFLQQALPGRAARASVGVEEGLELTCTNLRHIDQFQYALAVPIVRAGALGQAAQTIPRRPVKVPRLEKLLDLLAFCGGKDGTVGAKEFEPVPFGRVMAGGDLKAACRLEPAHGKAAGWRRRNAQVVYFTAQAEQTGKHGMAQYDATGPAVPADGDLSAVGRGA